MLQVKLTVYYAVSLTCNIYFLNSTYVIFNQFKSNKFSRFFFCWVYIPWISLSEGPFMILWSDFLAILVPVLPLCSGSPSQLNVSESLCLECLFFDELGLKRMNFLHFDV